MEKEWLLMYMRKIFFSVKKKYARPQSHITIINIPFFNHPFFNQVFLSAEEKIYSLQ